ncbi:MAG TPA: M56 family metallopeptidase, partial [Terriglobales bacterium]
LEEIPVLCSALTHGPITLGVRHPVVIIPEFLFINGSEEQWLSILAHEFAHIRRRDFLFNLLQELVYWPISFHPAATVMKRQISATRERLCDEMATARLIDRPSYARALVNIAGMLPAFHVVSQPDYSLGIFDGDFLEERIMKLLRTNPLSESWTKTSLLLSALFLLALCLSVSAFSFNVDSSTNTASVVPSAAGTSPGQDIYKVGPGIVPPKVISKVNPTYPEAAKKAKQKGNVQLALIIGADGSVENVRVEKSVSPDLDKSAIDAVRQWTWEPALKDGRPVKVEVHIDITFTLYK